VLGARPLTHVEMTQVDGVWSKGESVVLPNFMLEVVAESPLTIGAKAKSSLENLTKEAVSEAGSVEEIQVNFRLLLLPCTCQHHIHACACMLNHNHLFCRLVRFCSIRHHNSTLI